MGSSLFARPDPRYKRDAKSTPRFGAAADRAPPRSDRAALLARDANTRGPASDPEMPLGRGPGRRAHAPLALALRDAVFDHFPGPAAQGSGENRKRRLSIDRQAIGWTFYCLGV